MNSGSSSGISSGIEVTTSRRASAPLGKKTKDAAGTVNFYPDKTPGTLATPMVHFMIEPLLPLLLPIVQCIFHLRWLLSRPLKIRILPNWIPELPYLTYITIGDVLMTTPLVILCLAGYNQTFVAPSVDASGNTASYAIYLTFLTANKSNSIFAFLFSIPFERMIPHHFLASVVSILLGVGHTYVAFMLGGGSSDRRDLVEDADRHRHLSSDDSEFSMAGPNPDLMKYLVDGDTNLSGSLLMACIIGLVFLSCFRILRRYFFEFWLFTHIVLSLGVIGFCVLHDVGLIVFFAGWWLIDLVFRYAVMASCRYPTRATMRKVAEDICELRFPKPANFSYQPGQFVQIAVPAVGGLAFHPISISSAPHEEDVTMHIRSLGGWSHKLVQQAQDGGKDVSILVEGPYGSLSVNAMSPTYEHVLLVSGGVGVTHCQSVGKALQYQHIIQGRPLQRMRFVWAVRNLDLVRALPPLQELPGAGGSRGVVVEDEEESIVSEPAITKEVYCTRNIKQDESLLLEEDIVLYKNTRPDLEQIFQEMKKEAIDAGKSNVAVFGCGPRPLMDKLKACCRKYSQSAIGGCSPGVWFDLHIETFEF